MSESTQYEAQLTLKDRLNYPYLLANQILTFQRALLALEFSEREIRETIEGFVHMIPESWKDDKFNEKMDEATIIRKIDIRPKFCGQSATIEVCEELGIPTFKEVKTFDYYDLFQACIDLLDRRGLTSRRTFTEKFTGKPFNGETQEMSVEGV